MLANYSKHAKTQWVRQNAPRVSKQRFFFAPTCNEKLFSRLDLWVS